MGRGSDPLKLWGPMIWGTNPIKTWGRDGGLWGGYGDIGGEVLGIFMGGSGDP